MTLDDALKECLLRKRANPALTNQEVVDAVFSDANALRLLLAARIEFRQIPP
jgi:hypothetical protein